jgi:NAD(P)-dependent dehydrogenase (short-subunit alcohol dehydrogenase family)
MVHAVPAKAMEMIPACVPVRRHPKPEEIAQAIFFLASNNASFITGVTLPANGGKYMI